MNLTLPTDSDERKEIPITSGVLRYFPAALAGVARVSKAGNDKHNPGEPLHHARGKSMDHADCIVRHLMDVQDLLMAKARNYPLGAAYLASRDAVLAEASRLCWRALALSQELHERFGAPLAPGARLPEVEVPTDHENYKNDPSIQSLSDLIERIGDLPAIKDVPSQEPYDGHKADFQK